MVQLLDWPASQALSTEQTSAKPGFEKGAAFVDGRIVPIEEAKLPLLDWGFLRSDAFQETVSAWNGKVFRLDDHLTRFRRSAERLRMTIPHDDAELREIIHSLIATCGYQNAYVQIINTRGRPPIGSRDLRLCENRFQAFCMPYMWLKAPELQSLGTSLHISARLRVPPASADPMVKHYHWLDFQMGLLDAYDRGCETVVLSDLDGNVTEGPGFNIFAVVDGVLRTPERNMLDGMTRRTVLELCEALEIPVEIKALSPDDLRRASEVFLTTTAGGVVPVTSIEGAPVGEGGLGATTIALHRSYWQLRESGVHGDSVDYQSPVRAAWIA